VLCCFLSYFSISSDFFFRLSIFSVFIFMFLLHAILLFVKPDRRHFEAIVSLLSLWGFNRLHSRLFYSTRKTLHRVYEKWFNGNLFL